MGHKVYDFFVKTLKTIQLTLLTLFSINLFKWFKYYSKKAKVVVIVYPHFPKGFIKYFYSDAFLNDVAIVNGLVCNKIKYKLVITNRENLNNKIVIYNLGKGFAKRGENYSKAVINYATLLSKANTCLPSVNEVLLWENKAYMHQQFDALNIKTPKTIIYSLTELLPVARPFNYPFLVKKVHSSSARGIYKINNEQELNAIIKGNHNNVDDHLLLQELLPIDRDLRIIIVKGEIVLFYWRINATNEWKPTSTKFGSQVKYDDFPELWKEYILDVYKKLKVVTAAFDFCWSDNNYSNPPLLLEVSTSYQPNPMPPEKRKLDYGRYKSGFQLFNSWNKYFVAEVNRIKQATIKSYIENINGQ